MAPQLTHHIYGYVLYMYVCMSCVRMGRELAEVKEQWDCMPGSEWSLCAAIHDSKLFAVGEIWMM